jgi:hypothetical protein
LVNCFSFVTDFFIVVIFVEADEEEEYEDAVQDYDENEDSETVDSVTEAPSGDGIPDSPSGDGIPGIELSPSNRAIIATRERIVEFAPNVNFAPNDENEPNEDEAEAVGFTMDEIKDAVVAERTTISYIGNIFTFLSFCVESTVAPYNRVITEIGKSQLQLINTRQDGERLIDFKKRRFLEMKRILRQCSDVPLIDVNVLSADDLMNYIWQIRAVRSRRVLSKSSFANHRAALNHLYRYHNRRGFSHYVADNLKTLFKGLYRNLAKQKRTVGTPRRSRATIAVADDGGTVTTVCSNIDETEDFNEARDPISVELLKLLLKWFLEWNTTDGVFAYCYLLLTWHLMCRSENTALLLLSNLAWSLRLILSKFFSHSKTDQTGEESNHPRNLYANPHNPLLCPVTALGIYFTSCFSTELITDQFYLFPGKC